MSNVSDRQSIQCQLGQIAVLLLALFTGGCGDEYVPIRIESGTFFVNSQSDLNELAGVQQISGSLRIELPVFGPVEDPVVDLSPLKDLESVTGSVRIDDIDTIISLAPLSQLHTVGREFYFGHNDNVETLAPLLNLSHIGNLYIQDNDRLRDLNGLQNVDFDSAGYLQIALNDSLQSLHGLENLHVLKGRPGIGIEIAGNGQLTTLSGLNNLRETSALDIRQNPLLSDISALGNLNSLQVLNFYECPQISGLAALASLDTCMTLSLTDLPVTDFSVFSGVAINQLLIGRLPINRLDSFGERESLYKLQVYDMPQLSDLTGLSFLSRVEYLIVQANPVLTSLNGLSNMESVKYLRFSSNPELCTSLIEQWVESIIVDDEADVWWNGEC